MDPASLEGAWAEPHYESLIHRSCSGNVHLCPKCCTRSVFAIWPSISTRVMLWELCRWRGGAEALVLHLAAGMVVAYEQLKEEPIMEAFAKYDTYQALVTEEAGLQPRPIIRGHKVQRERWEKQTMLMVSYLD